MIPFLESAQCLKVTLKPCVRKAEGAKRTKEKQTERPVTDIP